MGDLSKNFSRSEFECRCGCGFDDVSLELVELLQEIRDEIKEPISINSACRCKDWNEQVGGAKRSQHLLGTAADIVVRACTPDYVYQYLDNKYPDTFGLGRYKSFVHVDVRERRARW
tara:strand:- start:1266 stop:1616 length:351 start_codon:yes stop_codon:yes gene_type:complete